MLFNSWGFIGIFLPTVLTLYYLTSRFVAYRCAIAVLVIASLVFYGAWNVNLLPVLLGSVVFNYSLSCGLGTVVHPVAKRTLLIVGITFNLGLLFFFKYAMFAASILTGASGIELGLGEIVLPIGISFFTFQQIAFLVDVHRRETYERGLVSYALFVTFFPQLIAGPIVH